jgi:hypothetical protein
MKSEKWVFISIQNANLFALNLAVSKQINLANIADNIAFFAVKKKGTHLRF